MAAAVSRSSRRLCRRPRSRPQASGFPAQRLIGGFWPVLSLGLSELPRVDGSRSHLPRQLFGRLPVVLAVALRALRLLLPLLQFPAVERLR